MQHNKLSFLLLAAGLAGVTATGTAFASGSVSTRSKIVTLTDSISQNGTSSLSARIGAAVNDGGVTTTSGTDQVITNINSLVNPIVSPGQSTYQTASEATSNISTWVNTMIHQFAVQVAALMKPGKPFSGAGQAVLSYSVPVKITGSAGKPVNGIVNDVCFISPSASYRCIGAKYNSHTTKIIYATYQQGAVAQGLPSSWTLPYPGEMKWAVLEVQSSGTGTSQSFLTIKGKTWHTINFLHNGGVLGQYGSYDAYQVGQVGGQQVLVNCGSALGTSCTQYQTGSDVPDPNNSQGVGQISFSQKTPVDLLAQQQIVPLEKKYGANSGILLYGETVAPVYKPSGSGTETPSVAVDIQQRVIMPGGRYFFIATGSGGRFNESGDIGYMLNQQMDQYSVSINGVTVKTNTFSKHVVSPTQTFSKSRSLSGIGRPTGPDIINPFKTGNQIYSYLNDTVNHLPASAYVHVAPIVIQ